MQSSQHVEKFCHIVIKLKLVRRFTVYKTHYKAVRIDSLFILGPGNENEKYDENCDKADSFFVTNLFYVTV